MGDAGALRDGELTHAIIGCAYRVHKALGFGFLESVYQRSMAIALAQAGIPALCEAAVPVFFEGHRVGDYRADLLVAHRIIVELKSVEAIVPAHEVQVVHYLTATGLDIGLLINFGPAGCEVRRKYRSTRTTRGDGQQAPSES